MLVHHTSLGVQRVLRRLDQAWSFFQQAYAGLSEAELTEPRTIGAWSVQDVVAHVTTWEAEALQYLPLIAQGGRPPRYTRYGGIDAFNAQTTERTRGLTLRQVLREQADAHGRLLELIERAPAAWLEGSPRFRRRLRLDTYGHYPQHAGAIRRWREQRGL